MNGASHVGTLTFPGRPGTPMTYPYILTARDFAGDSATDIIWVNATFGKIELWTITASGASPTVLTPGPVDRLRLAHDFDGDGHADLVFYGQIFSAIWRMNGETMLSSAYLPSPNRMEDGDIEMTGAARVGSDPRAMILWRNRTTGVNAWWYVNDDQSISGRYMPSVTDPNWVLIGPR